jgi:hypothetical protein
VTSCPVSCAFSCAASPDGRRRSLDPGPYRPVSPTPTRNGPHPQRETSNSQETCNASLRSTTRCARPDGTLNSKQKQKATWRGGYWAATHNVGNRGGRGVVIAIKKHLQTWDAHPAHRQGRHGARAAHYLNLPNSRPLITGSTPRQETHLQNKRARPRVRLALAHAE